MIGLTLGSLAPRKWHWSAAVGVIVAAIGLLWFAVAEPEPGEEPLVGLAALYAAIWAAIWVAAVHFGSFVRRELRSSRDRPTSRL